MNEANIDFQQLRIKHILFKSKVRSVLYGGNLDTEFFSSNGPINTWFNSTGISKYRNLAEMKDLIKLQQELNASANSLFSLYKSGQIEEAHRGLVEIENLSDQFLSLLLTLDKKLTAKEI
ncbi:histidine kinase [Adhaeribacter sp. BT258]|uniref:Histidine kinase n=1 Tax=Adhaeribacter terrigena TaxID=2793070 RepID=A0ABS1C2F4_9BACT|nr:histidine kinase [Adhaeribacter terrigena]MBK0403562.1 histidine kinase [Adhaeribacter terrigena]